MNKDGSIELVFSPKLEEGFHEAGVFDGIMKKIRINELTEYFKTLRNYKIDSIEIYLEGVAKSGELTQLLVSVEGKGGCKITLKPNPIS
jgi:hypothetical protein